MTQSHADRRAALVARQAQIIDRVTAECRLFTPGELRDLAMIVAEASRLTIALSPGHEIRRSGWARCAETIVW